MDLFSYDLPHYKITKPIRLIELFAGVGSQAKALTNLGADFEHYRVVEFDKYAVASYNAVHGTNFETSDITQIKGVDLGIVDTDRYDYILTYSFPCQDLSLAGKRAGMGKGTRSGLLWEVERLLNELEELPQILLMENVPQVIGKDNVRHFAKWVEFLENKSYSNYWQNLNARHYGIPQNRNRTFMISLLGEYRYNFPKRIKLTTTVGDYLDDMVDEKYYIDNERVADLIKHKPPTDKSTVSYGLAQREHTTYGWRDIAPTLMARDYKNPKTVSVKQATKQGYIECKIGGVADLSFPTSKLRRGRVQGNGKISPTITAQGNGIHRIEAIGDYRYDEGWRPRKDNMCPTITTRGGGGRSMSGSPIVITSKKQYGRMGTQAAKVINKQNISVGDTINPYNETLDKNGVCPTLTTRPEGFKTAILLVTERYSIKKPVCLNSKANGKQPSLQDRIYDNRGTATAITTSFHPNYTTGDLRIRKLTPRECWRLMGFTDTDFDKAEKVNSNTQLYKQAGNSIVVDVLENIFRQLL